jgi:hypothetical protein
MRGGAKNSGFTRLHRAYVEANVTESRITPIQARARPPECAGTRIVGALDLMTRNLQSQSSFAAVVEVLVEAAVGM